MAGIHQITSSLFIQSGSTAEFQNGIEIIGSLYNEGSIKASTFNGMLAGGDSNLIPLILGKALPDGTIVEGTITTPINTPVRITASGNFDTFCFIENQTLDDTVLSDSTWRTVSKGLGNGQFKKSFYEKAGGYNTSGIYEYLVIATNETDRKSSVKGITVKVTNIPLP